jgi:hypothetical protein
MISFIKGLFGSKKPTETQPHPLDIAKYTPPAEPAPVTQEQADKVLATKAWPFPTSTPPAAAPEPAPVAVPVEEKKPRKPRAKKEVSAIPVPKPTVKPRAKK